MEITRRGLLETGAASAFANAAHGGASGAPEARDGEGVRERLLLDFGWRFAFGHASDPARDFEFGLNQRTFAKQGERVAVAAAADFDDAGWRAVRLPHDWAVELPFASTPGWDASKGDDPLYDHGFKPLGRLFPETSIGWYRKTFDLPAADLGKRIAIEFDGVFRDCRVIFNGYALARNESGYAPFRVDVTDFANYGGANVLLVRVDATLGEGWFYEGAGIYRHVWLTKTDPLHVPQWGVFVRAAPSGAGAGLLISTEIANESSEPKTFEIVSIVRDAEGRVVASETQSASAAAGETRTVEQRAGIAAARRWRLEDPHLYELRTQVRVDGAVVDAVSTRFGVRTTRFDPERGFFLNDEPVKLKGTCNHQDHAGVGSALPDALQDFRIRRLKEMGSNAYRTSHNPPTPELLDACDRLGMLVLDETRPMSSSPEALSQLARMVRRDRNHPCVIAWSIGNEEQGQQGSPRGERIAHSMRPVIEALDGTRPLTAAMDGGWGAGITSVIDIMGYNYRTDQMEGFHQRFPRQPVMGTETGSTVSMRGEYVHDDARHIVVAYDKEHPWWATTAEFWWKIVAARPYIAGGFIWTGFDYRGEPTPFNQLPSISSYFGVMDTCGFPKDNYHYYRAWWSAEPVMHLFPHWNWDGREGQEIEVWCHSNLDRVELFVNGASAGVREVERNGHVEWRVAYAPGRIEARGYKEGRMVLSQRRETTGPPQRIVLRPDRARIGADGEDCVVVVAEIQDAQGRATPTADNQVTFSVSGPAEVIGVGNGDPTSLEPDKASARKAFNGLCMAIVQGTKSAGAINVRATSPGLAAGACRITSARAIPRPSL
ncbi:MAG TPA: beta-galactosidase GalA [Caulobacterales bacterium]|nr:beta-galactosidase GalA [Caulobacterales bacterium]